MSDPSPRDLILAQIAGDELVPLKGYPGAFVRKVSMKNVDELVVPKDKHAGAWMIMALTCDAKRTPLFTVEDLETLVELKAASFGVILRQVQYENGMLGLADEDIEKN